MHQCPKVLIRFLLHFPSVYTTSLKYLSEPLRYTSAVDHLLFLSIQKSFRMHDWLLPTRFDVDVGSNQCVFWKGVVFAALIQDPY